MIHLVKDFLIQNKNFSIPGIGTIYVERIPAQSDFVNRQLLPPSYHFRFDRYYDAPGKEFFQFISQKEGVEEYEAMRRYTEWATNLREEIGTGDSTVLTGIGTFTKSLSGELQFEASNQPKVFAIPVRAERIIRSNASHHMLVGDRETTTLAMNDLLQQEEARKRSTWWIYVLAIVLLASIAAVIYLRA